MNLLINDYDSRPPLDQELIFIEQQLDPMEHYNNLFYLAKNSYELNDNYSGLPIVDATQEGEYYSNSRKE